MDTFIWVIRLMIFGVLALALLGTVQNIVDDYRSRPRS
jgi:hypothetical protein